MYAYQAITKMWDF